MAIGGRQLGVAANGVFSTGNTDPIAGGRLWTEAAGAWNAMRVAAIADGIEPGEFMPTGPASSARSIVQQRVLRAEWCARGQCGKAAVPGTSNHGWGIAVDVVSRRAAAWIMRHGQRYGWSWDEGRRVGEWWHFRYVGGYEAREHPLYGLHRYERRRVRELDRLRAEHHDVARRRVLVDELTKRRKRIWKTAQSEGWDRKNRRRRYRVLLSRTK